MKSIFMGILFLICLTFAVPCSAQVKLYRYFDKVLGDERGISYSDKDGNPQNNPEWNYEEISEDKKEFYIKKQAEYLEAKPKPKSLEERIEKLEKRVKEIGG